MESTSGVHQPPACWETRTYSIPHYCLENDCVSSIGLMCHTLARTDSPQYPARIRGHLGVMSTPPFTVQVRTLHNYRGASLLEYVLSCRQD